MQPTKKGRLFSFKKWDFWSWVTLIVYVFLFAFIVYPLFTLLLNSFYNDEGSLTLDNYANFVKLKYFYGALWNSLKVSAFATLFSILLGVPLAYVTARYNVKCKGLIQILVIMSLLSLPLLVRIPGF